MNLRFKLALIRHFGNRNSDNKGFAVVIALGLGLVMILVGLTMTIRSQSDVTLSSTQKSTSRASSAAEVGATRYQQLINQNRIIASFPACISPPNRTAGVACTDSTASTISNTAQVSWFNISKYDGFGVCSNNLTGADIAGKSVTSWTDIDSNDISKGQYRLVSYTYTGIQPSISTESVNTVLGTGTLTVEGRVNVKGSGPSATTDISTSTAQLQVNIPIKQSSAINIPVPGLWTQGATSTGGYIDGNQKVDGNILVKCSVSNTAVTSMNTNNIEPGTGAVKQSNIAFTSIPAIPPTGQFTDLGSNLNTNITLPTTGAATSPAYPGRTVYKVGNIGKSTVTIPATAKVVIFLTGDIDKQTTIVHNCTGVTTCSPLDVLIIGTGTTSSGTPSICMNGGNSMTAFIFAPTYNVGVAGGGGNAYVINGSVWANRWGAASCDSSSNKVVVKQDQTIDWSTLEDLNISPQNVPPISDISSSWKKQPVQ